MTFKRWLTESNDTTGLCIKTSPQAKRHKPSLLSTVFTSFDYFYFFGLFSLLSTIFTSSNYFNFFRLFSLLWLLSLSFLSTWCITSGASPLVHHLLCTTSGAPPLVHNLWCITSGVSPLVHRLW